MITKEKAVIFLQNTDFKPLTTSISISAPLYALVKAYCDNRGWPISHFAVKAFRELLFREMEQQEKGIPEDLVAEAILSSSQVEDKKRVLEVMGVDEFSQKTSKDPFAGPKPTEEKFGNEPDKHGEKNKGSYLEEGDSFPREEKSLGKISKRELVRLVNRLCEDTARMREKLVAVEADLREIKRGKK